MPMKRRLLFGIFGLLFGVLTGVSLLSQQPGPPGTFRIHVTLIPVDIRVTDKAGKPVLDLKKEDFTILENGQRQDIRHFSLQTLSAMTSEAGKKTGLRRVPTLELSPEASRTFLILMGRGRIQRPFHSVDAAIRFVRDDLLQQDRVAVFAYNRATDFTADHERITQVLERYKKYSEKIESRLELRFSGLAAIYGSKEIPASLQPDINKIFEAPGAVGARQLPPGRVTDSGKIAEDARQVTDTLQRIDASSVARDTREDVFSDSGRSGVSPFDQLQVDTLTDLPFEEFVATNAMTLQDLQNIYTAIEYLRYMEGEKHLLFFSENGLFLPRLENDNSIAAIANDARVSIDTFQTGGVFGGNLLFSPPNPRDFGSGRQGALQRPVTKGSASRMFALSSLRHIAELTGGQASIHEDIGDALDRVNETTRSEYLLGYYPKNTNWDGRYRQITVKVNRPDVVVSFRHGYYARDTVEPYDREAFLTYSRIAAAGGYASEVKNLDFKVAASKEQSSSGAPQVRISLAIDSTHVPFQIVNGLYKGRLYVTVFYGDSHGRSLGDVWETMEMNLKEATYRKVLKEGIPFSTTVPLQVPNETLKVVVYCYDNDKVGSLFVKAR